MVGGCLEIQYTGASASCILEGSSAAKTLTSKIGVLGAEAVDAAFGVAGVLDLTALTVDTLAELAAVINAYADYTCAITYGDDIPTENVLTAKVQAKGQKGYILFQLPTSILKATALTTWARVKYLLALADTDQLATEYILNAIEPLAERIAERKLAARTLTKDLDGNGRTRLILPVAPINSVTSLYIDTARAFTAGSLIDPDDYVIYEEEGYLGLLHGLVFTEGVQDVRATWNGAFAVIPEDIQMAAVECVSWNRKRLNTGIIGTRTVVSPDGINTGMEITIPLSARRVFESYRDAR